MERLGDFRERLDEGALALRGEVKGFAHGRDGREHRAQVDDGLACLGGRVAQRLNRLFELDGRHARQPMREG